MKLGVAKICNQQIEIDIRRNGIYSVIRPIMRCRRRKPQSPYRENSARAERRSEENLPSAESEAVGYCNEGEGYRPRG